MSSLSCFFRAIFSASPAKLGRMLLIVILALQSVVSMAGDCSLAHEYYTDSVELAAEHPLATVELCDMQSSDHIEGDCSECSNNCCSCCLTLMHPATALQALTTSPDSHILTFNFTSVESPYYVFMRPPKALIV